MNTVKSEALIFGNKFEIIINTDCLTSIKSLNIGNVVKRVLTREIRKITGETNLNISNFKRKQEVINRALDDKNPRIEEYLGTKNKVLFLVIQYVGIQEIRDKKIKDLMQ